ncbi:MAG: hypothetical protein GY810_07765, partial [Aureispira sp.]|nr:hypothetical protein [Aureispira sp.]
MKIPSGKTKVEITKGCTTFQTGDTGYIEGPAFCYGSTVSVLVVKLLNDEIEGTIEHVEINRLKAIDPKTKKAIKEKEFNFKAKMLALEVTTKTLDDWLKVRSKKKAVNSETAYKSIVAEIKKSGVHPQEAIAIAAANSWKGFKAEWIVRTRSTKEIDFDSKGW